MIRGMTLITKLAAPKEDGVTMERLKARKKSPAVTILDRLKIKQFLITNVMNLGGVDVGLLRNTNPPSMEGLLP